MNYVSYLRVSTQRQGDSGLGLQAQRNAISNYLGENDILLSEFVEVESGKKNDRPELNRAIVEAKKNRATLLISRLDRLSRNVSFIFKLKDSGVEFLALDLPQMTTLTLGLTSIIAQHEREIISERIKLALAEKKKQGCKLGSPQNLNEQARLKGLETIKSNAYHNQANKQSGQVALMYRKDGMTLMAIADKLNESGYRTRYGKQFHARTVKNLIERYSDQD